ncbi:hypothetical protein [Nonlabens marinus]|uniref:DUF4890 domain-containing protein n=1 Tax=Nonlabens marinus S1-08 TaxID=1454201 RepID=W8VXC1_9FLAO|nr:hypothetical protein [Nonlabens marinus]BAO55667.1 hypothetical protein NMS_1658 [Nonlabens marinus S1-08]
MKNILLPLVFMFAIISVQAQKRGTDRQNDRRDIAANIAPEQLASMQAQKMTLALDLTDKQQKEIEAVLATSIAERKANKMTKEEFKALPTDQKMAMKQKSMDQKIATKRAFKKIMNEEQYSQFEKMAARQKNYRGKRMQRAKRG